MTAMHLLLLALRWTALAVAVLCALLALLLWRRPHEVDAVLWGQPSPDAPYREPEDGYERLPWPQ